ncbi:MAG: site-specific integrase [Patescibacteria group bacterium]
MEFINQFIEFLSKNRVSSISRRNYISDLRYFMNWYKTAYNEEFYPEKLNTSTIESFKLQNSNENILSFRRRLSSIRKLAKFALESNYINSDPFSQEKSLDLSSSEYPDTNGFRNHLHEKGISSISIKNYLSDVNQFAEWVNKVSISGSDWIVQKNFFESLNTELIEEYKKRLSRLNFSAPTINRKLSSIRNLISWASETGKIPHNFLKNKPTFPYNAKESFIPLDENPPNQTNDENIEAAGFEYSHLPPLRLAQKLGIGSARLLDFLLIDSLIKVSDSLGSLFSKEKKDLIFSSNKEKVPLIQDPLKFVNISKSFYDPLNVSTKNLSLGQKILHTIRFSRPKWYLKYHSYAIAHYIHFGILMMLMSVFGFGLYQRFWGPPNLSGVLGASFSPSPRIITVREKLSDSSGNPIISPSDVRFAIYDDATASGSSLLWEEVNTINPDEGGNFSASLGQAIPIPPEIFISNPSLWLGLSVSQTQELKPRRQLSQVGSADDAQTLQRMGIAGLDNYTNSILALDSTGNITIGGGGSHTFQAVDGQLILSGNNLTLTTVAGTNSNIELSPDGSGKIDITKPIHNSSDYSNIPNAIGSVEFDDTVSILATSSAQSALTINQTDLGPLISAYAGGIAKFTVDNFGNTGLAGHLSLSGNSPNIFSTSPSSTLSIGSYGNGTLVLQPVANGNIEFFSALNSLSSSGNLRLTGDIILATPSATTFGGIKYAWPTSGQSNGYFLKTNGSGNLSWSAVPDLTGIWDQTGRGNMGLGTTSPNFRLDVQDSKAATAAAQIFNTDTGGSSTGMVVKLGNTSSTTDINNKWVSFEQSGIGIVGLIKGNGSSGITFQGNGIADFAEYLKKNQNESIDFGLIVCINSNGLVSPCNTSNDNIVGVTSENPTFLGGENLGSGSIAVGLTGQVKTVVSNINGDIKAGDALTASYIPGVAVKANKEGRMVGRAVSKFDSSDCPFNPSQDFGLIGSSEQICEGSIYIVLNVSHYEPTIAQKSEYLKNIVFDQTQDGLYELKDAAGQTIVKSDAFATAIIANLTVGVINAGKIVVGSIDAREIKIAGENIKDYIASAINQAQLNSPIGNFDEVRTNVISPLSEKSNVIVRLPDKSSLTIENASQSAVASIDSEGNASFSGTLASGSLETKTVNSQNINSENASVTGTLRAGRIIADSIEGLQPTNYIDLATLSSQLAYVGNLRAVTGNFSDGLIVQSPSSFSDISIFGQLKIDSNLVLAANSINTFGIDLELQPLRQGGLSIMGGLIYIDTQGNAKFGSNAEFARDVSVHGNLSANIISPLSGQDLVVDIDGKSFIIRGSTQSGSLLTLDQNGDLTSSGSGTFNKLNLSLAQPAYAISPTEIIATGSAGIATISARQRELTINNKLVTSRSLIYVTPRIDTNNIVIYLLRQVPNVSFTIGVNSPLSKEIPFNWIIVN